MDLQLHRRAHSIRAAIGSQGNARARLPGRGGGCRLGGGLRRRPARFRSPAAASRRLNWITLYTLPPLEGTCPCVITGDHSPWWLAFVSVLVVSSIAIAADRPAADTSSKGLIARLAPEHPRLLVDQEGFDELKARLANDAELREWDERLRRDADRLLSASLPRHVLPDGKRLLGTSRRVLGHTYTLALVYRLHGDRRYLDRLWRELETVAALSRLQSAPLPRHGRDDPRPGHRLRLALRRSGASAARRPSARRSSRWGSSRGWKSTAKRRVVVAKRPTTGTRSATAA